MKLNIKSALFNLRRQPAISTVTIIGTSLAIFLIMIVVMMTEIGTAPIAPESNRPRFLHHSWTTVKSTGDQYSESTGAMSYSTFKSMFANMQTPEAVTAYNVTAFMNKALIQESGGIPMPAVFKGTDDVYWRVFDYDFVAGRPYNKVEFDAGMSFAVITANTARMLFGSTDVVGREFLMDYVPYSVCGVVRDVSKATERTFANVFIPFLSNEQCDKSWCQDLMGALSVTILARTPDDFDKIRDEYNANMARFNKDIASTGFAMHSLGRPYVQEKDVEAKYPTLEPDMDKERRERMAIYAILLLVPAINLSSMTESRLRGRMSEIGVRRAFGCTRSETMVMILAENFVVTVIAGIIGLLLSLIFAYLSQDFIFGFETVTVDIPQVKVGVTSLIHWSTFMWALFFCFILNLLSTGIPAWKASRSNIVDAIAGLRK